jgi:hypothetical protein
VSVTPPPGRGVGRGLVKSIVRGMVQHHARSAVSLSQQPADLPRARRPLRVYACHLQTVPHIVESSPKCERLRRWPRGLSRRLQKSYRYFNHIRVRSFIPTGAPLLDGPFRTHGVRIILEAARSVTQRRQPALLVTVDYPVAGLTGYPEISADVRHATPVSGRSLSLGTKLRTLSSLQMVIRRRSL